MLSELASPHIRCCLSAIPSDLMKSTAVDEGLSLMNQQFCSRENQLLQMLQKNEKSTQLCHIIASKVQSQMTWISANNKHLKLGISSKFDQLQNIPLTQTRCHDTFSSKILSTSSPAPNTFPQLLIGCQDAEGPFPIISLVTRTHGSL